MIGHTHKKIVKVGTRGSRLAHVQADMVIENLSVLYPDVTFKKIVIRTSGDWRPDQGEMRLKECEGGKGQFAKEIEEALLCGVIDIAVHSMKDMETRLPGKLSIQHMMVREDPRDCLLISNLADNVQSVDDLSVSCVVGTASVRRQAFLLAKRPDLDVRPIRGNVETRIQKLDNGQFSATVLAYAGLKRLELEHRADIILDHSIMLPAAGQGAVGIEMRTGEQEIENMLDKISDKRTVLCVSAERAAVNVLDGTCHTPIGAYARYEKNNIIKIDVAVAALDGSEIYYESASAKIDAISEAEDLGYKTGRSLKDTIPSFLLNQYIDEDEELLKGQVFIKGHSSKT